MLFKIQLQTTQRNQMIDITHQIEDLIPENFSWNVVIYTPHTTCAITINEWYDPDVVYDMLNFLQKLVPENADFSHFEGNSDAHIKSSLIWVSENLIVENGQILLGRWQKIFFCEFDGPRQRQVWVRI